MPRIGTSVSPDSRRETKRAKFERLAERRVTEALTRLRLIGNLANRQNYDYSDEHIRQVIEALEGELRLLKQRFRQEEGGNARSFSFRK